MIYHCKQVNIKRDNHDIMRQALDVEQKFPKRYKPKNESGCSAIIGADAQVYTQCLGNHTFSRLSVTATNIFKGGIKSESMNIQKLSLIQSNLKKNVYQIYFWDINRFRRNAINNLKGSKGVHDM